MKKTIKKLLALVLSAVMLLGMLSGCGNETPKQTDPDNTSSVPTLAGMLVLSTAASFKITYDSEGMVMDVTGANDDGTMLANKYECLGKSCSTVVKELIAASGEAGKLSGDVKNIVLKLAVGSTLPTELFLDVLTGDAETAAKEAGSSAVVTAIGLDGLDADGYINYESAQLLLCNQLGAEKFDSIHGDTAPHNDIYLLTVTIGDVQSSHNIDAITGLITEASDEEPTDDSGYTEDTTPAPDEDLPEESEKDIDVPVEDETTEA